MCKAAGTAVPTVITDNARVRVTRWDFARRGDNTGWHRHEHDYVVVPLFDGALEIDLGEAGGRVQAPMRNGAPYFREIGVEHDVISANDFPCAFVEIELMDRKG